MPPVSTNRRIFIQKVAALSLALSFPALAKESAQNKICIVYYSHTLNTHILALYLHALLQADLYQIHTTQPYPSDYQAMVAQATHEKDKHFTPALQEDLSFLDSYHTLLVGSPLWSLSLSSPIRTLCAKAPLEGKSLAPFITNAGFGFGNALKEIRSLCPKTQILNAFEMPFKQLEKTNKNLKSFNQTALQQGTAFAQLPQDKIHQWLLSLKLENL